MKIHIYKKIVLGTLVFALSLVYSPFASAKKEKSEGGLKKVVAIGHVDSGYMGFSNLAPGQLGDFFKNKIQKKLEKKGYVVVLPEPKLEKEEKAEEIPQPKTTAEAMKYVQKMQEQMQKVALQSAGKYVHQPVASQGLFNFVISKGERHIESGGIFSEAEYFTGAPISGADFSTSSMKVTLGCEQLDPQSGRIIDQHTAKASSTRFARVGGATYYTMEDTSDPDRAFDRMFDRAANDCVKWIDKKMANAPWEGQIVEKRGGQFMINAGSNAGIQEGMSFEAFKRQAVTGGGVRLGTEEVSKGTVQITQVHEGYSLAQPVSGSITKGDIIKPAQ